MIGKETVNPELPDPDAEVLLIDEEELVVRS
jgi:hypothetical protein